MTSPSDGALDQNDLRDYGVQRARDLAFDAVYDLWQRRKSEGMRQIDLARIIGRDPAWVSRALRGPGNWTMQTFGQLVVGLNGDIEVTVHAMEDPQQPASNYHAYVGYGPTILEGFLPAEKITTSPKIHSTSYSSTGTLHDQD